MTGAIFTGICRRCGPLAIAGYGEIEYDAMVQQAIFASRQLAKRQLTWLRREPGAEWFDPGSLAVAVQVAAHLQDRLGQRRPD